MNYCCGVGFGIWSICESLISPDHGIHVSISHPNIDLDGDTPLLLVEEVTMLEVIYH
jgi:hypothetical protein